MRLSSPRGVLLTEQTDSLYVEMSDNILLCQDFLSVAVSPPWARAISQNGVPYYIKYELERLKKYFTSQIKL